MVFFEVPLRSVPCKYVDIYQSTMVLWVYKFTTHWAHRSTFVNDLLILAWFVFPAVIP